MSNKRRSDIEIILNFLEALDKHKEYAFSRICGVCGINPEKAKQLADVLVQKLQ